MKKILSFLVAVAVSGWSISQSTDVVMNAGNNGATFNTCLGGLYDSGGTGASAPYGNNESYVVTVCPDNPTDFITLQWTVFNLDCTDNVPGPPTDADNITIYDGDNTGAPTLGTYYCGDLTPGDIFGATPMNPTGCLTIEFNSNANGTGDFNAQISCETPCDPGTALGEIVGGPAPDSIAVCVGDIVTFQDAGSLPGPSGLFTLQDWVWQWQDGTPNDTIAGPGQVTHSWDTPGQYVVQLTVIDDNNCTNLNATDIQVFVTTYPTFDPFPLDTTLCIGETLTLDAFPDQYETTWSGFPLSTWIDDNCMEDLTGIVQSTPMAITGYDPNISLDAGNPDIFSICVDIEHSFIGDFVLQVQCPTGQIMTLHQQGGGGTNLGDPEQGIIDCTDPATFGNPWNYCFTPTAPNTWVDAVGLGLQIPNGTGGQSLPPGDYAPIDPFSALDGCPINGTWQLLFTDLWGADDGSMPGWSINFDPALNPPVTVFTPQIGQASDSSWWDMGSPFITGSTPDGNSITIAPTSPGTYGYTFNVINSFGCQFDSTVFVTVDSIPPIDAGLDTALCNGLAGVVIGPTTVSASCDYVLDLVDTFGDGWNGNTITITINGVPTDYTVPTGTGSTFTIPVNHGDQIDLQWNATGAWQSECEIYFYDADGNLIHSDGTGFTTPSTNMFTFTADCMGGMVYSWTPAATLDDPSIPNPLANPVSTTTYTLSAYPQGHPDCAVTDDVTVSLGGGLDPGTDSTALLCFEGPAVDLFNWLGGTPQTTNAQWLDPAGTPITMPITPATAVPGLYEYQLDSAGCTASAFIDVQIFQVTGVTVVTNSDCQACNGQIVVTGANGIGPYEYSIDGGLTFQSSDTFAGLCGAATPGVNYSFIIQDSLGCQGTVADDVLDINIPTLDPVAFADASCFGVCDGTIDLTGTNIVNYSIDNGVTNQATGNFTALCPGTYDVYVDNGFGCTVTDQVTIVEPPVLDITSISPDVQVCPGETVTATVTGANGIGNVTFTWESGGNQLGTGSPIDIVATGNMLVCVTMADDCPTTDQECFSITEPAPVWPMMTSDVTNGCEPLTVTFSNLSNGNIATTEWSFSDGSTVLVNGNGDVTHMFSDPGMYDVSMLITTVGGCVYDTTYTSYIEVFSNPTANFIHAPIPATIYDTEINFTDYSSDDVTQWMWNFGPGVNPGTSSVQNPTALYPPGVPGDYPMTLHVYNDNGCVDSIAAVISVVNDVVIYAPNVFTPDGDEYNEGWRVHITGIDPYDFHLTMFNRWGEIVWESYNTEGVWNGHYGGGGLVQDGTYVWVIQTKDTYTDKKYEFRGHVTVLK